MDNYYDILGVEKGATAEQIKSAYRRMAMKYHPDRNSDPEAQETFKKINAAYEVLGDEQLRREYDHGSSRARNGNGGTHGFSGSPFDDFFSHFFNQRPAAPETSNGADLEIHTTIDLKSAMLGGRVKVGGDIPVTCDPCQGTGAENAKLQTCSTCKGHGVVLSQMIGIRMQHTCPDCHGAGQVPQRPCPVCHGQGHTMQRKDWEINIPAGVESGSRLRLTGEGMKGRNRSGDLFIHISVAEHPIFTRQGPHLHVTVPLRFSQVALGCEVDVPNLIQSVRVKVPEGTQHDAVLIQKGKGGKTLNGSVGDLYVHIKVETPVKMSKAQKQIMETLDKSMNPKNTPQAQGFWDKIKNLF